MNITYTTVKNKEELFQILALQQANLFKNVSEEEKKEEGFLTVEHSFDILNQMNELCPHIIAKADNEIAGYALCMHPSFGNQIEVLKPMFNILNGPIFKGEKYMVMGQICVSKKHRKKGVFRGLYNAMKLHVSPQFDSIITEVDAKNTRSLQAHYTVGFTELATYPSGGQDWKVVSLKT